jgi:hypothetical protein
LFDDVACCDVDIACDVDELDGTCCEDELDGVGGRCMVLSAERSEAKLCWFGPAGALKLICDCDEPNAVLPAAVVTSEAMAVSTAAFKGEASPTRDDVGVNGLACEEGTAVDDALLDVLSRKYGRENLERLASSRGGVGSCRRDALAGRFNNSA